MKFTGTEEWHVQVGPNNVKVMSLEQIDDALRLKLIHQRTNLWTDGMGAWRSLGDVFAEAGQEPDHQTHPRQAAPTRVGGFQAHAAPVPAARGALPPPLAHTTARPSAAPAAARPGPAPLVASRAPAPLVQSAPPQRGSLAPAPLVSAAPAHAAPPPPPFNVAVVARAAEPVVEMEDVEEEDDKWHVQISPTEVKVMTLDQLDDAFRLDIVTAQTKIWQEGLDEWLTLGEVAGLDEEDGDTAAPPEAAPVTSRGPGPAPLVAAASARPGPAPLVASVPPGSVRPGPAPLVSGAAGSMRPGPAPLASMPPGSVRPGPAPLASMPPGSVRPGPAPLQPTVPRALTSVPPLAMEVPREPQRKLPNQTFVRTLMWTAAVAACFAGLHRNGGSFALAQAAGKTAVYDSAVKALGGPGVSTPVEMGRRISETREKYRLGDLSPTSAVGENQLKSSFEEPEQADGEEAETEAVPTSPQKAPSRGGSAAPAARAETFPSGIGVGKSKKKKGKQDHFDPLNAELP